MKRAISLLDQREWDAVEFGKQDKQTQGTHNKYLSCISCKARARFNTGSAKRRATFAARHTANCVLKRASWSAFQYLS
jgi:hypothetical protein